MNKFMSRPSPSKEFLTIETSLVKEKPSKEGEIWKDPTMGPDWQFQRSRLFQKQCYSIVLFQRPLQNFKMLIVFLNNKVVSFFINFKSIFLLLVIGINFFFPARTLAVNPNSACFATVQIARSDLNRETTQEKDVVKNLLEVCQMAREPSGRLAKNANGQPYAVFIPASEYQPLVPLDNSSVYTWTFSTSSIKKFLMRSLIEIGIDGVTFASQRIGQCFFQTGSEMPDTFYPSIIIDAPVPGLLQTKTGTRCFNNCSRFATAPAHQEYPLLMAPLNTSSSVYVWKSSTFSKKKLLTRMVIGGGIYTGWKIWQHHLPICFELSNNVYQNMEEGIEEVVGTPHKPIFVNNLNHFFNHPYPTCCALRRIKIQFFSVHIDFFLDKLSAFYEDPLNFSRYFYFSSAFLQENRELINQFSAIIEDLCLFIPNFDRQLNPLNFLNLTRIFSDSNFHEIVFEKLVFYFWTFAFYLRIYELSEFNEQDISRLQEFRVRGWIHPARLLEIYLLI